MSDIIDLATAYLKRPGTAENGHAIAGELETRLAELQAERETLSATAIDPLTDGEKARAAKAKAVSLSLDIDRAVALRNAMADAVAKAGDDEAEKARRVRYAAAEKERDELATFVANRYPEIVAELLPILKRLRASDAEIGQVNANRPADAEPLAVAEAVGRGLNPANTFQRSLTAMRLPDSKRLEGYAWPEAAPSMASAFAWPRCARVDSRASE